MLNFLYNYATFLLEILTLVAAILVTLLGIVAIVGKSKLQSKEKIEIKKVNDKYKQLKQTLNSQLLSKEQLKAQKKAAKEKKKAQKAAKKANKKDDSNSNDINRKHIFVLDFVGDIRAQAVDALREEITAILTVAKPNDEVVVKIESPGGVVHGYGLAASQLKRIRDRNIPLIACVDKVAASGGYMMACVANRILAAPFAILGSIGVVTQLPNFHKFLKKHNVDFEQITAGEYKRTLTMFGENTNKDREKMQQEIDETHTLFKNFVAQNRHQVDIDKIATGEHWFGQQALELNLVDTLTTSDDYLLDASKNSDIYSVKYSIKKSISEKLGFSIQNSLDRLLHN